MIEYGRLLLEFMRIKRFFRDFTIIYYVLCIAVSVGLAVAAVFLISSYSGIRTYNVDFSAIRKETGEDGTDYLLLRGLSLRKGNYNIGIGYVADAAANVEISLDNDTYLFDELPASLDGESRSYEFEIKTGTDRGRIDFSYPSGSGFKLAYITVSSDKPLYYDGLIFGIIMILLIPAVWAGVYFYRHSTHKAALIVTVVLVIIQILPFILKPGLHMGTDTRVQMMRMEGVYYGLLDGQFPVVIYPEWNNSYGQLGVLYPNVFLYIPAVFRLWGMSQLGACKLYLFIIICASAAIALGSARTIFKKQWQIILTVSVICLDNMRLLDMLGDGRIGGALLAEMFYPLVIAGLIELFYHNRNKWFLLAYGIAGVFCCHVVSATLVCIFVLVFAACSYRKLTEKGTIRAVANAVLLFSGLVLGTAAMFLKFYFTDWGQGNLRWKDFTSTLWPRGRIYDDIIWLYAFLLVFICLICAMRVILRKRYDLFRGSFVTSSFICAVLLLWMSTKAFPWKALCRIPAVGYYTDMLQDSYRFVTLMVCFLAFCIPRLMDFVELSVEETRQKQSRMVAMSCVLIAVSCAVSYISLYYDFFSNNQNMLYYDPVIGEIESVSEDYLPSGTQTEWYTSDTGYISDEAGVSSLAYERQGTYVYYSYTNSSEGAYVEFPRFYYDGYIARDEMEDEVEVVKGDRNRTRVYLKKTDTPAVIRMWYHVPWYMTLAVSLSLSLWVCSIMVLSIRIYKRIE